MNLPPENEEKLQIPESYPETSRQRVFPTSAQALSLFVFCLILVGFVGSHLQVLNLEMGLLQTQILCLLLPTFFYTKSLRIDFIETFRLKPINPRLAFITILTAGAAFILITQLSILQERLIPAPSHYRERLQDVLLTFRGMSLLWSVALIAILPGICEELLFRGFILSGLSKRLHPGLSVVLTGFLFGLLHLDPYRFLLVSVLGILFGFMVLKTGSILTGMLAHMTNNSIILILSRIVPLNEVTTTVDKPPDVPMLFLLLALVVFILGFRSMGAMNK